MTNHQKIWNILRRKEPTTIDKIAKATEIPATSVALYVRPLFNAEYLEAEMTNSVRIYHSTPIKLIKDTGEIAPVLSKSSSILTDKNILEEFYVTEKSETEKEKKAHKNLVPILQALIKNGKDEIYQREIWQKAKLEPFALKRWLPKLIELGVLLDTWERDRNSPLYKSNIKKAKKLLRLVNSYKSHTLAFDKFKSS